MIVITLRVFSSVGFSLFSKIMFVKLLISCVKAWAWALSFASIVVLFPSESVKDACLARV